MPSDRRSSSGRGSGRGGGGRSDRTPSGRGGGRGRDGRPGGGRDRRSGGGSKGGRDSRGAGRSRGSDSRSDEPRTEAERRAAHVRATRGPRRTQSSPELEQAKIDNRETEHWIDEGSVRSEAEAATRRASTGRPRREVDPEVVAEIHDTADPKRAARLSERLASASAALDRERFDEAKRMVTPLIRELPRVAAVHEVHGLACYRLGKWRQAAQSLELARQLRSDATLLPVLADCYRAMKRWDDVDNVWREVKSASPTHDVMAEARIVAASSLADRGELKAAIDLMVSSAKRPKRVRHHHLRQWYVLADFYDRAGDTVGATRWFREVAAHDAAFADVRDRLRGLGR